MRQVVGSVLAVLIAACAASQVVRKAEHTAPVNFVFKIEVYKYGKLQGNATAFSVRTVNNATFVLTNRHLCHEGSDVDYVLIDNSERHFDARFYRNHMFADLCLLRVEQVLPTVYFADPVYGESVSVIGAPHGAFPIYEAGVVRDPAFIHSSIRGEDYYFQAQVVKVNTDDGSSGSPVFNSEQHVVGVIFGTTDGSHSFMVPAQTAQEFVEHLAD